LLGTLLVIHDASPFVQYAMRIMSYRLKL